MVRCLIAERGCGDGGCRASFFSAASRVRRALLQATGRARFCLAIGLHVPAVILTYNLIRMASEGGCLLTCGVFDWCLAGIAVACQLLVFLLIRPLPPLPLEATGGEQAKFQGMVR